jgi:hypothetical protein
MENKDKIILIATYALVAVVVGMVGMFCYAIIDPTVDDDKVFAIIGPSFQTVVGGFLGLITGIQIGENSDK